MCLTSNNNYKGGTVLRSGFSRLLTVIICITAALAAVMFTRTVIHGSAAESKIYLYYNDRAWTRANHPAHKNDKGVFYAPLTYFVQLDDVKVRINNTLQTFVITRGEHYLSFDIVSGYAANEEKIRIPIRTYEHEGEHYVPMDAVCHYLNLKYEVMTSKYSADIAVRVSNGKEQYTFADLLRRRHPGFLGEVETSTSVRETTAPPVTTPPGTTASPKDSNEPDDTEPPKLPERVIYISVKGALGEYTSSVLEVLNEFDFKATFFVEKDRAGSNTRQLMKLISAGHSLALRASDGDIGSNASADEAIADIEDGNILLARMVKRKTRVWSPPDGVKLSDDAVSALDKMGYTVWTDNVEASNGRKSARERANTMIRGIWNNEVCSLGFEDGEDTAEIMRYVFEFIEQHREACDIRIAA